MTQPRPFAIAFVITVIVGALYGYVTWDLLEDSEAGSSPLSGFLDRATPYPPRPTNSPDPFSLPPKTEVELVVLRNAMAFDGLTFALLRVPVDTANPEDPPEPQFTVSLNDEETIDSLHYHLAVDGKGRLYVLNQTDAQHLVSLVKEVRSITEATGRYWWRLETKVSCRPVDHLHIPRIVPASGVLDEGSYMRVGVSEYHWGGTRTLVRKQGPGDWIWGFGRRRLPTCLSELVGAVNERFGGQKGYDDQVIQYLQEFTGIWGVLTTRTMVRDFLNQ
ncbi:hypothetical protein FA15DRAFT_674931 [Coprinopsis marcescibilis]|uniref:Uncharacterized protein n=1 Tax=Coprinopsis marcescibilis TaxID=230819 RepID=A0A5C3KFJ1_COPMA|nr:hypothetical protein FA15DRAFT_674931 [Coprinopsis marcescibilis]